MYFKKIVFNIVSIMVIDQSRVCIKYYKKSLHLILAFYLALFVFVPFFKVEIYANIKPVTLKVNYVAPSSSNERYDGALFQSISGAISYANNGDVIQLVSNGKENVTIDSEKNITIDLNGYVLQGNNTSSVITNKGELTIIDSNKDRTHYFQIQSNGLWKYTEALLSGATVYYCIDGVLYDSDKTNSNKNQLDFIPINSGSETIYVCVYGGCITGGIRGIENGIRKENINSLYNDPNNYELGILNFKSGNIVGNGPVPDGGGIFNWYDLNIYGGNIIGNVATSEGGGIYNDGNFSQTSSNIQNAKINYNKSGESGGIYSRCLDFSISNSDLSFNKANKFGGMWLQGGTINASINNCTINNNYSSGSAGGILLKTGNSNVTITDTSICGNCAEKGAGIFVQGADSASMKVNIVGTQGKGTIISGNELINSGTVGGGIYYQNSSNSSELCFEGLVQIFDNVDSNSNSNNLYIDSNKIIKFTDDNALLQTSKIYLSKAINSGSTEVSLTTDSYSNNISSYLFCDNSNYRIIARSFLSQGNTTYKFSILDFVHPLTTSNNSQQKTCYDENAFFELNTNDSNIVGLNILYKEQSIQDVTSNWQDMCPINTGTYDVKIYYYNELLSSSSLILNKRSIKASSISVANKSYDGSKNATLSSGKITGIPSNLLETGKVIVDIDAKFDDSNSGNGKNVTVKFSIFGDYKRNFENPIIKPDNTSFTANIKG